MRGDPRHAFKDGDMLRLHVHEPNGSDGGCVETCAGLEALAQKELGKSSLPTANYAQSMRMKQGQVTENPAKGLENITADVDPAWMGNGDKEKNVSAGEGGGHSRGGGGSGVGGGPMWMEML